MCSTHMNVLCHSLLIFNFFIMYVYMKCTCVVHIYVIIHSYIIICILKHNYNYACISPASKTMLGLTWSQFFHLVLSFLRRCKRVTVYIQPLFCSRRTSGNPFIALLVECRGVSVSIDNLIQKMSLILVTIFRRSYNLELSS